MSCVSEEQQEEDQLSGMTTDPSELEENGLTVSDPTSDPLLCSSVSWLCSQRLSQIV